jgi:hypothetical protein
MVVMDMVLADRLLVDMVLAEKAGMDSRVPHNFVETAVNYKTYLILYIVFKNTLHAIKNKIDKNIAYFYLISSLFIFIF